MRPPVDAVVVVVFAQLVVVIAAAVVMVAVLLLRLVEVMTRMAVAVDTAICSQEGKSL